MNIMQIILTQRRIRLTNRKGEFAFDGLSRNEIPMVRRPTRMTKDTSMAMGIMIRVYRIRVVSYITTHLKYQSPQSLGVVRLHRFLVKFSHYQSRRLILSS